MIQASLGEILAAALEEREPVSPHLMSAGHAQRTTGRHLARLIAEHSEATFAAAWDALDDIPDNMLQLLHSPEGWSALASFLSYGSIVIRPTIH